MSMDIQCYEDARQLIEDTPYGRRHGRRKLANNTYLERRGDNGAPAYAVKLHATDVVTYHPDGRIVFDSGGWHTLTTRNRISRFSPCDAYSDRGITFISRGHGWSADRERYPLADGMTLHPDGTMTGAGPDPRETQRKRTKIKRYCREYMRAFAAGEVPAPSAGDCFYCAMRTTGGESLGDATTDAEHLWSHVDEKYYVPSLLANAVKAYPVAPIAHNLIAATWNPTLPNAKQWREGSFAEFAREQLAKSLRRYMMQRVGLGERR